jgi:hypothetical protein
LKLHERDIVRRKTALTCTSTELTIKDGVAAEYAWEEGTGSSRRSLSPSQVGELELEWVSWSMATLEYNLLSIPVKMGVFYMIHNST